MFAIDPQHVWVVVMMVSEPDFGVVRLKTNPCRSDFLPSHCFINIILFVKF